MQFGTLKMIFLEQVFLEIVSASFARKRLSELDSFLLCRLNYEQR